MAIPQDSLVVQYERIGKFTFTKLTNLNIFRYSYLIFRYIENELIKESEDADDADSTTSADDADSTDSAASADSTTSADDAAATVKAYFDEEKKKYILEGEHDASTLQYFVNKFNNRLTLCKDCRSSNTRFRVSRVSVFLLCLSCNVVEEIFGDFKYWIIPYIRERAYVKAVPPRSIIGIGIDKIYLEKEKEIDKLCNIYNAAIKDKRVNCKTEEEDCNCENCMDIPLYISIGDMLHIKEMLILLFVSSIIKKEFIKNIIKFKKELKMLTVEPISKIYLILVLIVNLHDTPNPDGFQNTPFYTDAASNKENKNIFLQLLRMLLNTGIIDRNIIVEWYNNKWNIFTEEENLSLQEYLVIVLPYIKSFTRTIEYREYFSVKRISQSDYADIA